jgi:hypothetical protein
MKVVAFHRPRVRRWRRVGNEVSFPYGVCAAALIQLILLAGCGTPERPVPPGPRFGFTDVTAAAGLSDFKHETGGFGQSLMPEIVGGGGGFIDYDDDGWVDILLVQGGIWPHVERRFVQAVQLFRNDRNGAFVEVTEEAGLAGVAAYAFGVAVADTDNDGDEDFLLTTLHRNLFFQNEGGRFREVGREAGLARHDVWSTSAAFFDADRDGWLDLFVGSYVDWTPENDLNCLHRGKKVFCTPQEYIGRASHFYRNNGDGTFAERSREAGFWSGVDTTRDKTLGVAVLDFNEDGWPDLATGNDTENNHLFENLGDGTFRETGMPSGVAVSQHGVPTAGMGIDAGVIDSTGRVSIVVGNFSEESVSLFTYAGNRQFVDRAATSRLAYPTNLTLTFGLALADFDLDADLDLVLGNGHVLTHINEMAQAITFRQPSQLFLNRGDGNFELYRATGGALTDSLVVRGLAVTDYDRDGDIDVLAIENGGPAHLWRNEASGAHFLRVRLNGVVGNRDGLDGHLVAVTDGRAQHRWIRGGGSFLASHEKWATFGLGIHTEVDTLRVFWPSGAIDVFTDVAADQEIEITEGTGRYENTPR